MIELSVGAERPRTKITMRENGELLDTSQFTFQAKVISCRNVRKQITKTTKIYGYRDQRPNVIIDWQPTGELSTLDPGYYTFQLKATDPYTGAEYYYNDTIYLKSVV